MLSLWIEVSTAYYGADLHERTVAALLPPIHGARGNLIVQHTRNHFHHQTPGDSDDEVFMVRVQLAALLQRKVNGTLYIEQAMSGGAHPPLLPPSPLPLA